MAPQGRKRKQDDNDNDKSLSTVIHTAPGSHITKKQPTSKKAKKKPRDDKGQEGARAFLQASRSAKKMGEPALSAKSDIRKRADEILDLLNSRGDVGSLAALGSAELQSLRREHAEIFKPSTTGIFSNCSSPGSVDVARTVGKVLKDGLSAASAYGSLSSRSTGIKQPDWMRWSQDTKDLRSLNKRAFELATKVVEQGILGIAPGKAMQLQPSRRAGELEQLAWEMLEEVMPRTGEATWGTVAKSQLRALIALGKVAGQDAGTQVQG